MSWQKKLNIWQNAGLISPTQQQAIREFEQVNGKSKIAFILKALAVFCIGLGIISMIAANWQEIPAAVKLSVDFLILVGLAVGIVRASDQGNKLHREILILGDALMILATIGLIAQVFQLQTVDWRGYFLWSLLTLPLMFVTSKLILPLFWIPVFSLSGLDLLNRTNWYAKFSEKLAEAMPYGVVLFILLLAVIIYELVDGWLKDRKPQIVKAAKFWLIFYFATFIIWADFRGYVLFYYHDTLKMTAGCPLALLLGMMVLLIGWNSHQRQHLMASSMLILITSFLLILPGLPNNSEMVSDLWGLFLTLSSLALVMVYACKNSRFRLFNWASGLMAVRIFIVYLQVFGSLLMTGLGLIVSGVILLLLISGWKKFKIKFYCGEEKRDVKA